MMVSLCLQTRSNLDMHLEYILLDIKHFDVSIYT